MVAFHEYPLFDDDNLAQQPLKQQMMLPWTWYNWNKYLKFFVEMECYKKLIFLGIFIKSFVEWFACEILV